MTTATLRIPAKSTQISGGHLGYGVDILASISLGTLADALGRMEHDDLDPGERPMNADQCRDALLRELLGGWSWSELVLARIPAIVEMQDGYSEIHRRLVKADSELDNLRPLEFLLKSEASTALEQCIDKIHDQTLELIGAENMRRAQANEIATLQRERDEARSAWENVRDNTLNPAHTMTRQGLEDVVDACHEIALRILRTTPTPGAQP